MSFIALPTKAKRGCNWQSHVIDYQTLVQISLRFSGALFFGFLCMDEYRLRKKLGLSQDQDITEFLRSLA
jgi:hypothetical protein